MQGKRNRQILEVGSCRPTGIYPCEKGRLYNARHEAAAPLVFPRVQEPAIFMRSMSTEAIVLPPSV